MKIETAIETLTDFERGRRASVEPDVHTAINLGIEALKEVQLLRRHLPPDQQPKLHGETKE